MKSGMPLPHTYGSIGFCPFCLQRIKNVKLVALTVCNPRVNIPLLSSGGGDGILNMKETNLLPSNFCCSV